MNRSLTRPITQREISTYRRDGEVCLREMFDREWVEWLRDTADTIPGEYGNRAFLWPFYDAYRELAFDSPVGEIAATMMGSRTCGLTIDITFIKDSHSKSLTSWHHDQPYCQVQGEHVCGMWIGLDRSNADNGAMEWIRGSHKWSRVFEPDPFDGSGHYKAVHEGRERILDIDAEREKYDIVMFETEPGDCIVAMRWCCTRPMTTTPVTPAVPSPTPCMVTPRDSPPSRRAAGSRTPATWSFQMATSFRPTTRWCRVSGQSGSDRLGRGRRLGRIWMARPISSRATRYTSNA